MLPNLNILGRHRRTDAVTAPDSADGVTGSITAIAETPRARFLTETRPSCLPDRSSTSFLEVGAGDHVVQVLATEVDVDVIVTARRQSERDLVIELRATVAPTSMMGKFSSDVTGRLPDPQRPDSKCPLHGE